MQFETHAHGPIHSYRPLYVKTYIGTEIEHMCARLLPDNGAYSALSQLYTRADNSV